MTINKKFMIPIPIFIAVLVSVIVATVMMNGERVVDQNNMGTSTNNNELNLEENKMKKLFVTIEGQKLEVKLAENATVSALLKILPLELSMSDLNGNEKYAYLAETLPVDAVRPGRVEAGDVMLFGDDCLVIFYESFDTSYSYTKIGHIDNLPELGSREVVVGFLGE